MMFSKSRDEIHFEAREYKLVSITPVSEMWLVCVDPDTWSEEFDEWVQAQPVPFVNVPSSVHLDVPFTAEKVVAFSTWVNEAEQKIQNFCIMEDLREERYLSSHYAYGVALSRDCRNRESALDLIERMTWHFRRQEEELVKGES